MGDEPQNKPAVQPLDPAALDSRMESLSVFAGRLAHDFNNIMNSIMNTAALLKMTGGLTQETTELVDLIDRSTRRGAELTLALMSFARPVSASPVGAEANALARQAAETIRKRLPASVTVQVVPSDQPIETRVDEMLFSQALSALAENAAEAMNGNGTLTLSVAAVAGAGNRPAVRFSLRDTGPGVPEPYRQLVFDPLFSTRQGVKGAGLGLCRAYRLMKDQGGMLRLAPQQPEQGAEFWIELPVIKAEGLKVAGVVKNAPSGAGGAPEQTGRKVRVLFADDDEANRLLGSRLLEKFGHTVKLARDGLEALQIFQAGSDLYDVLVVDETMPGLTGTEVISMARKVRSDLPAILITGNDTSLTSADDGVIHVQKPYDAEEFIRLVASAAKSSH